MNEDDDIVDGPFDLDPSEIDVLETPEGGIRPQLEVLLDEETWDLVETLAQLDGVSLTEAVRRAVHAQAAVRA